MLTGEIKRLFAKSNVIASSELDDKIMTAVLQAFEKSAKPLAKLQPNVWEMIVKTRIAKLAIAAVVIVAVLIGVNQFGGSIDGASVAWSQVVEQIRNYTKYKCRQEVVREKGSEFPTMQVYHLNLSQRRQEFEDGSIHIIDMRGADVIVAELYPDQMKATVTKFVGAGPRKDPHVIEMIKLFEQGSIEELGTREYDEKVLHGFRYQQNDYNEFTIWVDAETKLPVEIEIEHSNRGQTIFLDEFEFEFDLDPSAFSTAIPEGYEVESLTREDYKPIEEAKESETSIQDYGPAESKEVAAEDVQSGLSHTAYAVEKLLWMEKIVTIETLDPLGTKAKVYITWIQSDNGYTIIIVQGNYYDEKIMAWIPKQQLVFESSSGIKLYTHPNGSIYAQSFLKSFAKAIPEFFDYNSLSEERFTVMIVMSDGVVMSLSANREVSNEKLQETVESLIEIKDVEW